MIEPIRNTADIIDSRDVIARIESLKESWAEATTADPDDYSLSRDDWAVGLDDEEADEIEALLELAQDSGEKLADWEDGVTLVRDSYFTEYAEQLAEDCGMIARDAVWPLQHIDWDAAAEDLKIDYQEFDFDGETYWARS